MFSKFFTFCHGKIVRDTSLDLNLTFEDQTDLLEEDLFQLSYNNNELVLDIGWYEAIKKFKIYIIKIEDWENPIYEKEVFVFTDLQNEIQKSIKIFDQEVQKSDFSMI